MLTFVIATLLGCPGSGDGKDTSEGSDTGDDAEVAVCDPHDVPCLDEMILDLSLHDDKISDGEVSTSTDGADFVTTVDARAGGYSNASRNPWVYVKFARDGATRVDIDDEAALESQEWHMSLRRYIVRLNSGDSGPSCVAAATLRGDYASVDAVPDDAEFVEEDFYTDECAIVEDASGLPGSPAVAMGAWWSYGSCTETTDKPFLLKLEDGSVIKLVIEAYYDGDGQQECNEQGGTDAESAVYTLRWAFLE